MRFDSVSLEETREWLNWRRDSKSFRFFFSTSMFDATTFSSFRSRSHTSLLALVRNMGLARFLRMPSSFFSDCVIFFSMPRMLSWICFITPDLRSSGTGKRTEMPGMLDGM